MIGSSPPGSNASRPVRADADGKVTVPALYGAHKITVGGQSRQVELAPGKGPVQVDMR
jgi:hypothetical protein